MECALESSIELFRPFLLGRGSTERASCTREGSEGVSIQPLNPWDIVLTSAEFIAVATLLGNPVRRLLFRTENADSLSRMVVSWIMSLTTCVAMLALILLWLCRYPGLIILPLAWGLLAAALTSNVLLYRTHLLHLRPDMGAARKKLASFRGRWFVLVFLAI